MNNKLFICSRRQITTDVFNNSTEYYAIIRNAHIDFVITPTKMLGEKAGY